MRFARALGITVAAATLVACGAGQGYSYFGSSESPAAGPALTITAPLANATLTGLTDVTGACEDGAPVTLTGPIRGGRAQTACSGSTFTLPIALNAAAAGDQTLTLTSTGAAGGVTVRTHAVKMPPPSRRGINYFAPCGNNAGQYYWKTQYDAGGVNKLRIAWDLDYYHARGMNLFRVPLDWETLQPTLSGPLTPWMLGCTSYVLTQAQARGLKVILDLHNYGRYAVNNNAGANWTDADKIIIGQPGVPRAALADVWTKLATAFNAHPALYGYDVMNEPHDMNDDTLWPDLAQRATDAIRAVDVVTPVIVAGDNWSYAATWRTTANENLAVTDPSSKLIYEAHAYFDAYGSGQYNQTYDANAATATTGVDRVRPFVEWLNAKNFRGLVGEFGVPEANNPNVANGDVRWYQALDAFLNYLTLNGVAATAWAGGYLWIEYGQTNSWYTLSPVDAPSRPSTPVDRGPMTSLMKYPGHD